MSGSQIFVVVFAAASLAVSVLAIWRVARASGVRYKPLWIVGSLFGFVGVATSFDRADDLYLQIGIQIPVLMWTPVSGGSVLKALFPLLAAMAVVKFSPSRMRETEAAVFD